MAGHKQEHKSYYDVLGVNKSDDAQTIKKAWHKLSLKYHPDRLSGAEKETGERKMKEINEAYTVLSDPEKRPLYDRFGKEGLEGNGSDPFAELFAKQRGRQDVVPPVKIAVELTLKDLYLGTSITKEFQRRNLCKACNRTGCKDKVRHSCTACKGSGVTIQHVRRGPVVQQVPMACGTCSGSGIEPNAALCEKCKGVIFEVETQTFSHNIPPGLCNNDVVEIPDLGNEIPPELCGSGSKRGNVLLVIQEVPHTVFKRTDTGDADLAIILKLSLAEALCGFKRSVEHVDGRKLAIIEHECTNPGTMKVIKQEGMPQRSNTIARGNLIVKFDVEFPTSLTIENKKTLYSCLTGDNTFDVSDLSLPSDHVMTHMTTFSESDIPESDNSGPHAQQVQCPIQ